MANWSDILAQSTQPGRRPFFERILLNETLHHTTFAGWITLFVGIAAGFLLGRTAHAFLRAAAAPLRKRGQNLRAIICDSLAGPLNLAIIGLGIFIGIGQLAPSDELEQTARKGLALLYIIALGWLLYNLVDLLDFALTELTPKTGVKVDNHLVPLVRKAVRILLTTILLLFTAQNIFDANISAWLAGLGIAGLAVSLAAQDSIKNVFGSLTILFDHPFKQGDFIAFGADMGTVEDIGFRSTRIRTVTGSVLTVPNSKISDNTVDNLSRRITQRRLVNITIPLDTPVAKVEQAVTIIRDVLASPTIAPMLSPADPARVYFDEFNADSLNIKVMYWFNSTDYWQYLDHCQRVNLEILRRFDQAGILLSLPGRSLHIHPAKPASTQDAEKWH